MCQIYYEAKAHLLNLSIVCLKQRASSIVLFVAYFFAFDVLFLGDDGLLFS